MVRPHRIVEHHGWSVCNNFSHSELKCHDRSKKYKPVYTEKIYSCLGHNFVTIYWISVSLQKQKTKIVIYTMWVFRDYIAIPICCLWAIVLFSVQRILVKLHKSLENHRRACQVQNSTLNWKEMVKVLRQGPFSGAQVAVTSLVIHTFLLFFFIHKICVLTIFIW